jgi:hypothetical protein
MNRKDPGAPRGSDPQRHRERLPWARNVAISLPAGQTAANGAREGRLATNLVMPR